MRTLSGRSAAGPPAAGHPAPPAPPHAPPPPPLSIEVVEGDAPHTLSKEAAELFRLAVRTPRRAAAAYALAGLAHAAVMTAVFIMLRGEEFLARRPSVALLALAVFLALALPVVPTVTAVAVSGQLLKVLTPLAYVVAVFFLLLPFGTFYPAVFIQRLLAEVLAPSALTLLVANRRLKSVGPPALVFLSALLAGLWLTYPAAEYVAGLDIHGAGRAWSSS